MAALDIPRNNEWWEESQRVLSIQCPALVSLLEECLMMKVAVVATKNSWSEQDDKGSRGHFLIMTTENQLPNQPFGWTFLYLATAALLMKTTKL
jgi:hypothetical protein